ncbi:MAG: HEAT repeat domain-containing protein [Planctomycetota bacterium]|nr:HEAT repeat domain-containing protein [Planctomycetota bacterium]
MDRLLGNIERQCLSEPDNQDSIRQLAQAYQRAGQKYSGPVLERAISRLCGSHRFKREKAATTLVSLGSQAVTAVEECLSAKSWPVRQKAAEVLRRIGPEASRSFDTMLKHKDLNVRREAIKAFTNLKDEAKIPDIITSTMETSLAFLNFSAKSISTIDPSILGQLVKELTVPNTTKFRQTVIFMDAFGEAAVPYYLDVLRSPRDINYFIRQRLASLGEKALKGLEKALSEPEAQLKIEVLWTLQSMIDVPGIVPLLERLCEDDDLWVRQQAIESLITFSFYQNIAELPLWLDRALKDEAPELRETAANVILRLGADTESLLPTLLSHWDGFDRQTRIRLAQLFLDQGSGKDDYLDAWGRLVYDDELIVRMKALYGLRSLKGRGARLLPELKMLAKNSTGSFKVWVHRVVKKMQA